MAVRRTRITASVDAERGVFMISVAAELAEMHPQTLRMYEARGLIEPQALAEGHAAVLARGRRAAAPDPGADLRRRDEPRRRREGLRARGAARAHAAQGRRARAARGRAARPRSRGSRRSSARSRRRSSATRRSRPTSCRCACAGARDAESGYLDDVQARRTSTRRLPFGTLSRAAGAPRGAGPATPGRHRALAAAGEPQAAEERRRGRGAAGVCRRRSGEWSPAGVPSGSEEHPVSPWGGTRLSGDSRSRAVSHLPWGYRVTRGRIRPRGNLPTPRLGRRRRCPTTPPPAARTAAARWPRGRASARPATALAQTACPRGRAGGRADRRPLPAPAPARARRREGGLARARPDARAAGGHRARALRRRAAPRRASGCAARRG